MSGCMQTTSFAAANADSQSCKDCITVIWTAADVWAWLCMTLWSCKNRLQEHMSNYAKAPKAYFDQAQGACHNIDLLWGTSTHAFLYRASMQYGTDCQRTGRTIRQELMLRMNRQKQLWIAMEVLEFWEARCWRVQESQPSIRENLI